MIKNIIKFINVFFFILIIPMFILANENNILDESINYVLDGNYIYKNQYISNDNNESYYYNNIYQLINSKDNKNDYLKGLIEMDGEKSKIFFEDYYTNYPKSKFADNSVVRVAEYYYSNGLYIQSSEWYKKIPIEYPESIHLEKSISYFLNSLLISGYKDTSDFYINKFRKEFTNINFSKEYLLETEINNRYKKKNKKNDGKEVKKFSVQIGSFKNYDLAKAKKTILGNEGFLCRIDETLINGNIFYSVRVGTFNSQKLALKEKKRLISRI